MSDFVLEKASVIAQRPTKKIYRDGDTLVKLFNQEYSPSDVLNEALNISRVAETGLPIPKLKEVTKIDGQWAIIAEYIEGVPLSQLIRENPEKKTGYLTRFVELQKVIHTKRSVLLTKHHDKMTRKLNLADLDGTTRYELLTRLDSMPRHNKVCHGDFCPSNVIVTPDDEMYVIDWAHATQGNASADAARTYLVFCLNDERELADEYLDLFAGELDTGHSERHYIQKWLPIVAASQSVKAIAAEKNLLSSWLSVVEYE